MQAFKPETKKNKIEFKTATQREKFILEKSV